MLHSISEVADTFASTLLSDYVISTPAPVSLFGMYSGLKGIDTIIKHCKVAQDMR
jgi:hypothetical protein